MGRPVQLVIAGAMKAGTTSLFRYLAQHPRIATHEQREMCYFATDEFARGYDEAFLKYFGNNVDPEKVLLIKHVLIMYSRDAIDRLYEHNPHVKIVVLLRDPVKRAYSAYWYARRMGWESLKTFEEALEAEPARLREGWARWRNCFYLHQGDYYEHVMKIVERFDREQLQVFILEDMKERPLEVIRKILLSIGLDDDFTPSIETRHNMATQAKSELAARAFARLLTTGNSLRKIIRSLLPYPLLNKVKEGIKDINSREFIPPPMNPKTRESLLRHFESSNDKLAKWLGRDLSCWSHLDE